MPCPPEIASLMARWLTDNGQVFFTPEVRPKISWGRLALQGGALKFPWLGKVVCVKNSQKTHLIVQFGRTLRTLSSTILGYLFGELKGAGLSRLSSSPPSLGFRVVFSWAKIPSKHRSPTEVWRRAAGVISTVSWVYSGGWWPFEGYPEIAISWKKNRYH